MSTKLKRLSTLVNEVSFPCGLAAAQGLYVLGVHAYIATDGDLCLAVDKPHGMGYTREVLFFHMEDAPEVAELILGIYNEQRQKQQEQQEEAS